MNRYRTLIPALVIVALGAVVVVARPGHTASRQAPALPVGFVDVQRVAEESVVGQNAHKEADALRSRIQNDLEKKKKTAYLTADQRAELTSLLAKAQTTDADKARIAELQATSERLEKELFDLSQKTSPTDAEQKRIRDLTQLQQEAAAHFGSDTEAAQNELDTKAEVIATQLNDRITKSVEEIANERGLAMVVHKEARLYGGVDITQEVVNRLKK